MSGLLVKSTAFMKDNLKSFNEADIKVPVILGGAALTPKFVNEDCSSIYNGKILYGKDAFTDLRFMNEYMENKKKGNWSDTEGFIDKENVYIKLANAKLSKKEDIKINSHIKKKNIDINQVTERSDYAVEENPIKVPFVGSKLIQNNDLEIEDLLFYLDKKALFSGQWQIKKSKSQNSHEYADYLKSYAEPLLEKWINIIKDLSLIHI